MNLIGQTGIMLYKRGRKKSVCIIEKHICSKFEHFCYTAPRYVRKIISVLKVVRRSQGNRQVNKVITRVIDTCTSVAPPV